MANLTTTRSLTVTPSAADPVALTSNATAWVSGSYVEVVAATAAAIQLVGLAFTPTGTSGHAVEIDIAKGTAGNESVVATFRIFNRFGDNQDSWFPLPIPVDLIPASTRVSARLRTSVVGSTRTHSISIGYYEQLEAEHRTTSLHAALPAAANDIVMVGTTVTWTNSAWAEVTSGLSAAIHLSGFTLNAPTSAPFDLEIDVGIGTAGAETVITTFRDSISFLGQGYWHSLPAVLRIDASTRIATRIRKQSITAGDWGIALTHYGALLEAEEVTFEEEGFIGLTWVEFTSRDDVMRPWAMIALDDPESYYGGFKEARVTKWGRIIRALSEPRSGEMEGTDFTFDMSDSDRLLRTLLFQDSTKFFVNRPAVVRMIDDPSRRQQLVPRTVMRGLISGYKPQPGLQFSMAAQDALTRKFTQSQGGVEIPKRTIGTTDFPGVSADFVSLPVPIIYGEVSDKNEVTTTVSGPGADDPPGWPRRALTKPTNLVGTPFGSHSASVTRRYAVTAQNFVYSGGYPSPPYAAPGWSPADHRGETDATFVDVPGCPTDDEIINGGGAVGVTLTWGDSSNPAPWITKVPRPADYTDAYRVYGRTAGVLKFLDFADVGFNVPGPVYHDGKRPYGAPDFDILKLDGDPPTVNHSLVDGDGTTVTTDDGIGMVPVVYTGLRTLGDGNTWHEFLVCGHAIKEVLAWYVDGIRQSNTTEGTVLDATHADAWLMPGFAGWTTIFGSARYVDYNGRRYGVVYGRGVIPDQVALGEKKLTLNLRGIESVGDGTGTLITDIHLQYRHMMQNWVLGDYQSGSWLSTPTYSDSEAVPQMDDDSFDVVAAVAAERVSGGYVGGGMMGPTGFLNVREVIAQWNQSGDVDSGFNRRGQFFVSMVSESVASQSSEIVITDLNDVIKDSFDIVDDLESHYNDIPYYYARDYSGQTQNGWKHNGRVEDTTSQTNYEAVLTSPSLMLEFVRSAVTAEDVASRRLLRMKDPPRLARFSLGLRGANFELGEIVTLTHYAGVGPTGYTGQPMRILRHELDPGQYSVTLECMDLKQLFQTAFILGDETALPATWTSATSAEQIYGYLCDETTGLFSDGSPGKRLR
jgi:hypothetical protein